MKALMYLFFILFSFFSSFIFSQDLRHIPYLCQKGHLEKAVNLYLEASKDKHQTEILTQMALNILEKSSYSKELEEQLITLYGIGIAKISDRMGFLKTCIRSSQPSIQLGAIYLLGELHDDETDELLTEAMSSPYFPVRMEALFRLCAKKSRHSLSYLESLKNLLPDEYGFFFPDLYAMIGSTDAMNAFKALFTSLHLPVRIAAISSTAKYGRDDFLPMIRIAATHSNPAEQESAAFALGELNDLHSEKKLKELSCSKYEDVKLASALALVKLGHHEHELTIKKLALKGNPFAIVHLKDLPDCEDLLSELAYSSDSITSLNATVALLSLKNKKALSSLKRILLKLPDNDGYVPIFSLGRTLYAWKWMPAAQSNPKYKNSNLSAISMQFKEELLIRSIELGDESFIELANDILQSDKLELIPTAIRLLENIQSSEVVEMLKKNAQKPGSPMTRGYCLLSLYRTSNDEEAKKQFFQFIENGFQHQLIQFRPMLERTAENIYEQYELTPVSQSRLLLESYEAMATKRDPKAIEHILYALRDGHEANRPALAGLLLNAVQ